MEKKHKKEQPHIHTHKTLYLCRCLFPCGKENFIIYEKKRKKYLRKKVYGENYTQGHHWGNEVKIEEPAVA